jgi:hypothetical protein
VISAPYLDAKATRFSEINVNRASRRVDKTVSVVGQIAHALTVTRVRYFANANCEARPATLLAAG